MAFRHVGRPALPSGVQIGQGVEGGHARPEGVVGSSQQFGTPGGDTGPGVEQRHLGLPAVEGPVQGRQVGDLQRDDDQAGRGGDVDNDLGSAARRDREPEGEQRRARECERRCDAARYERPEQERVPNQVTRPANRSVER